MRWALKWNGNLDSYYKLEETEKLRPEDKAPNIEPFRWYIEAYNELSTCRNNSMGVSAIPFTSILEFAKINNITGEEFDDFLYLIRQLDNEYLIYHESKEKVRDGKIKNKSN